MVAGGLSAPASDAGGLRGSSLGSTLDARAAVIPLPPVPSPVGIITAIFPILVMMARLYRSGAYAAAPLSALPLCGIAEIEETTISATGHLTIRPPISRSHSP